MPNLEDLDPRAGKKFMLFVGRSKSGKTSVAATFPGPQILDFDKRIIGAKWIADRDGLKVPFEQFSKGWSEVDEYLEKFELNLNFNRMQGPRTLTVDTVGSMLRLFIVDAMELTSGMVIGKAKNSKNNLRLEGPADYKYEASAVYQVFDYLKRLPCNVIVCAHIIDKYGKPGNDPDMSDEDREKWEKKIQETLPIGEKLNLRDKIGENVLSLFSEVYRFERRETSSGQIKHFVKFHTDLAATALPLPFGEHDITGVNFYRWWNERLEEGYAAGRSLQPREVGKAAKKE